MESFLKYLPIPILAMVLQTAIAKNSIPNQSRKSKHTQRKDDPYFHSPLHISHSKHHSLYQPILGTLNLFLQAIQPIMLHIEEYI